MTPGEMTPKLPTKVSSRAISTGRPWRCSELPTGPLKGTLSSQSHGTECPVCVPPKCKLIFRIKHKPPLGFWNGGEEAGLQGGPEAGPCLVPADAHLRSHACPAELLPHLEEEWWAWRVSDIYYLLGPRVYVLVINRILHQ